MGWKPTGGGGDLAPFSGARVYNSAAFTDISSPTDLTFNSETFDTDDYHSTSTNPERLTIPEDGWYVVGGNIRFSADGGGDYRGTFIRVDDTTAIAASALPFVADTGAMQVQIETGPRQFTTGQYLELRVAHDSPTNVVDVTQNTDTSPVFWIQRLDGLLGSGTELTIAAGVVTITTGFHTLDTQDDDATDELDTINGGTTGRLLVLKSAADARDPTVTDGTGNIVLAGGAGFTLSDTDDTITLLYDGANWVELSRSDNS